MYIYQFKFNNFRVNTILNSLVLSIISCTVEIIFLNHELSIMSLVHFLASES